MESSAKGDFFQEFGLEVVDGAVEVGEVYPLFAMITKIVDETPGSVIVELNFHIRASVSIDTLERLNVLKERMFESGIFVSKVVSKEPSVEVACQTIIFGRKAELNA